MAKAKSEDKIVQLVSAPANLMTVVAQAAEGEPQATPQHVLALGLTESGSIVAVTKNDVEDAVTI